MKSAPIRKKATARVTYLIHKNDSHGGKSDVSCSECAEYEYELMPNKTRRDSE